MDEYISVDVSAWSVLGDEMMGTKPKCWLQSPDDQKWLFEQKAREHSDDDWSEKIASELACLSVLPHARVELATRYGGRGIITSEIMSEAAKRFVRELLRVNRSRLSELPR